MLFVVTIAYPTLNSVLTVLALMVLIGIKPMNTKILLAAIAIVVAFGIAAVIGPVTVPTPVVAQNMTGDNITVMGGNMSGGNMTSG